MTERDTIDWIKGEIVRHRRALDELHGDQDRVSLLMRDQHARELTLAEKALEDRTSPTLRLSLEGGAEEHNTLPMRLLGQLLNRLQRAITDVGWALRAGPSIEGEPPAQLFRATSMRVAAIQPGSFELVLRQDRAGDDLQEELELEQTTLVEESVTTVLELIGAAETSGLDDEMESIASRIGRVASRKIQLFAMKVGEVEADAVFAWRGANRQTVELSPEGARYLAEWLGVFEEEPEQFKVRGILHAGDETGGTFKFEDSATRKLYEGRVDEGVVRGKRLGSTYEATIQTIWRLSSRTDSRLARHRLLEVSTLD